jgi:pyocin large subunit-like protein
VYTSVSPGSSASAASNSATVSLPPPIFGYVSNAVSTPQLPYDIAGVGFPKLQRHFGDHGSDFGAQTPQIYKDKSEDFIRTAPSNPNVQAKYSADQNTLRAYDPSTNTFGSYDTQSQNVRSYMKPDPAIHGYPTNQEYWESQPGELVEGETLLKLVAQFLK